MAEKRILYTDADGNVCVIIPAPKAQLEGETDNQFAKRIADEVVPKGTSYKIINAAALPQDRIFRKAWKEDGTIDFNKAKEVQKDRLRAVRPEAFKALDEQALRALETGNTNLLEQVKTEKQILRDAPTHPSIEAAKTIEELKVAGPPSLTVELEK